MRIRGGLMSGLKRVMTDTCVKLGKKILEIRRKWRIKNLHTGSGGDDAGQRGDNRIY